MIRNIVPNITTVKFKNNHVVYERFTKCTIKDYEFNASYNPTLLSGSQGLLTPYSSSISGSTVYVTPQDNWGTLKDFATGSISGSEFSPYVTVVGLYNDAQDLLAVGKMAAPMPLSPNTDVTFLIKWDMNFKDDLYPTATPTSTPTPTPTSTPSPTPTPTPTATSTPTPTPTFGSVANIYARFGSNTSSPTTASVYYQVNAGPITYAGDISDSTCTQFVVPASIGDTLYVGLQTGSVNVSFGAAPSASCSGFGATSYCGTSSMFSHVIGASDYDVSISGKTVLNVLQTC